MGKEIRMFNGNMLVVGDEVCFYSFLSMQKYRYGEISTWKRQLLDQVGILDLIGKIAHSNAN